MKRLMIMAGGTGGHIFPAMAVAEQLLAMNIEVTWLGSKRGLETKFVTAKDIRLDQVNMVGLKGKGVWRYLSMPFILMQALVQAMAIMRHRRPDAVLGMGGFVAAPGGLAAKFLRVPLLIHEANAIVGLTNRFLAKLATKVMLGFSESRGAPAKAIHVGNPVRKAILEASIARRSRPRGLRLLVVGGSQGALTLNREMPSIVAQFRNRGDIEIWHQCGAGKLEATRECYQHHGLEVRLQEFIENMAEAYQWATMVICRAGAMTLAELQVMALPAILVPYPYAANDHQAENARRIEQAGAAVLIPDGKFQAHTVLPILERFVEEPEQLSRMSERAAGLAKPDAASAVADACRELLYA